MEKSKGELIVSDESSATFTRLVLDVPMNGVMFKASSDTTTFSLNIDGFYRGDTKIKSISDLLYELAKRFKEGSQYELKEIE